MNTPDSFQALRNANPRTKPGFTESVEAAADAVRGQIDATFEDVGGHAEVLGRGTRWRPLLGVSVVGASLAAVALVAFLTVGSTGGSPGGVENAAAAVERAATLTAASAEHSGTAVVQISHNSEVQAGTTVRWHDRDLIVSRDTPRRSGDAESTFLVVDGTLYSVDPDDGGWVVLGKPENVGSGNGTTRPNLAAVRDEIGGATLRRIIQGLTGLTTSHLPDGSTVYRGTLAAGLNGRGLSFSAGQPIPGLAFGYEAQEEGADPTAPLDVAVTVGADGLVREDVVQWGTAGSVWTYTVMYSRLGKTSAPVAPTNARPLQEQSAPGKPRTEARTSE